MVHIVLVGAGNMGFAMLSKWLAGHELTNSVAEPAIPQCSGKPQHTFSVIEPVDTLRQRAAAIGASVYADESQLPEKLAADVVVIATKPPMVSEIAALYASRLSPSGLVISVAAGIATAALEKRVGNSLAVIRCMPNMPASIGEGMMVCCSGSNASDYHRSVAQELLSAIGKVVFINDENLMDAVTAVSGSGPAYLFLFIESLSQAGTAVGLDGDLALELAKQTVYGASKLAIESSDSPTTLRRQVTSPNGTTAAALDVLTRPGSGLPALVHQAVAAAKNRSEKLGKS
ncbi:pyrroline-5-carboxylate reductase [Mesorhizobium silamurunense]|uniref:pyrroline-5-carboxylate reductase n=1 Tax=Mesorhizobium silamurunense TaxID=499528 RepID=UPI0017806EE4|nr:pyrroline-5-carboxylate reductase [Mesorhizobium silamurunense]